ncbi:hypothetical protein LguiB_008966 [Lonicera macranthoides]
MGCISSKQAKSTSSAYDLPLPIGANGSGKKSDHKSHTKVGLGLVEKINDEHKEKKDELARSKTSKKGNSEKKPHFSIRFGRLTEGEHVAAGWPTWLTAIAGEAIEGWLPLNSDNYEKLEKIGQGTYSSVYRARDVETGKMVALKKVRFDNFQPDSVRFMAREITILRRLDHPNVMKLEGIITSRLSCSIYFVFEYMEHDLTGLLSCPDIKFTDAQIKCYMKQLLCGLEHCHSRGVLHRDIKVSNILVNNEGVLKIADFGLANFLYPISKQPLTSRVVTLWYRPPELLLGSTRYGVSVDMWSVGCVFAELFIGRPILKGRTEVEQLHKIFKLCGSPTEDYWQKSKLPLAAMFKPQNTYENTLRERCKEFPKSAVNLIETFLSMDPHKRGTATSALVSEYFTTKPYACDPSSLPKYPPNKEIDAKFREEARRKKAGAKVRGSGSSKNPRRVRKTLQEANSFCRVVPTEEVEGNGELTGRRNRSNAHFPKGKGATVCRGSLKASYDTVSEASQATTATEVSQGDSICTVPAQMTASSGFNRSKQPKRGVSSKLYDQVPSRSQTLHSARQENEESTRGFRTPGNARDENSKWKMQRQRSCHPNPNSVDSHDVFETEEYSEDYNDEQENVGPLLTQSHTRKENHTHQAVPRSRFYRGTAN